MYVLIACEYTQVVCQEFRKLGMKAFSCDIKPCIGSFPEWHIQNNVLLELDRKWDLIIAHPPCTHLAGSGGTKLWEKYQNGQVQDAMSFFLKIMNANCPHIAVENPVGLVSRLFRPPDQIVQPWQFGHQETKATCLWLKNLPPLHPTNVVSKPGLRWLNQTPSGSQKYSSGSIHRERTYSGIAAAMASQWTNFILQNR